MLKLIATIPWRVAARKRVPVAGKGGVMLYDVHIYAVVRVKVPDVEADTQLDAINKAETVTDLHALFPNYAEEINGYMVDEHGDEEHTKSHYYEVRHLHNPMQEI